MLIEVFIPTHNHEKFIAKAIDSVVNQTTSYQYSIVVSNDFSTDNTSKEVEKMLKKYSDKIRYINHTENIGIMNNYYQYLNASEADIILFCEVDDYWVDEAKLEKQVDFLVSNENCAVVFSATKNIEYSTEETVRIATDLGGKNKYYLHDILPHNTLNTLSAVGIKNTIKKSYPDWYTQCNTPDGPLYFVLLGTQYYIQYMNFIGTNYRINGGVWSGLKKIDQQKSAIETYEVLLKNLNEKDKKFCKLAILKSLLTLVKEYRKVDFKMSLFYCKRIITYNSFSIKKLIYILLLPLVLLDVFD